MEFDDNGTWRIFSSSFIIPPVSPPFSVCFMGRKDTPTTRKPLVDCFDVINLIRTRPNDSFIYGDNPDECLLSTSSIFISENIQFQTTVSKSTVWNYVFNFNLNFLSDGALPQW